MSRLRQEVIEVEFAGDARKPVLVAGRGTRLPLEVSLATVSSLAKDRVGPRADRWLTTVPHIGYNCVSESPGRRDHTMHRISVTEAERDFGNLVNRVYSEGISVELERGDRVVARLTPAGPRSPLKIQDLNVFLASLPKLEEDAEALGQDIRAIRRDFPAEPNPWD